MLIRSSLSLFAANLPYVQAHGPAAFNVTVPLTEGSTGGHAGRPKSPSGGPATVTIIQTLWSSCPACPVPSFSNTSTSPTLAAPAFNATISDAMAPTSTFLFGGTGPVPVIVPEQTGGLTSSPQAPVAGASDSYVSQSPTTGSPTAADAGSQLTSERAAASVSVTATPAIASNTAGGTASAPGAVATSGTTIAVAVGISAPTSPGLPTQPSNAAATLMQGTHLAIAAGLFQFVLL